LPPDPFSLSNLVHLVENGTINKLIWTPIERVLGFKKLSALYKTLEKESPPQTFVRSVLSRLEIEYSVKKKELPPSSGPLIIVANHPFGALEALILVDYLAQYRTDIRILGNVFLKRIYPLSTLIFGVNPLRDKKAISQNRTVIREIYHWLKDRHCLITFPAGNVSYLHFRQPFIDDGVWNKQIARLARSTASNVLPIAVDGKNSFWFYLLGNHLHALRYGLELLNKQGKAISLHQEAIITPDKFTTIPLDSDLILYFREKVMAPLNR